MNKKVLITSAAFTGFGIINAIVFLILACLHIAPTISFGNVYSILLIFLYFLAVWAPVLLTLLFKIKFNLSLIIAYEIFVILALVVGCLWSVYDMTSVYDKVVHLASGILLAMLGYNLLTETKGNKLNLVWTFILVLSFTMLLGSFWEICEFSFDTFLGENTQHWMGFEGRNVLMDTMLDVICDFAGGIIGGVAVILYAKYKSKVKVTDAQTEDLEVGKCSI